MRTTLLWGGVIAFLITISAVSLFVARSADDKVVDPSAGENVTDPVPGIRDQVTAANSLTFPSTQDTESRVDASEKSVSPETESPPASNTQIALLSDQVDAIASTFLTESPDTRSLVALITQLSRDANVVESTIVTDPKTGQVTGKLHAPGLGDNCSFEIDGDNMRVTLSGSGQIWGNTRALRDLSMSFKKGESEFGCVVQYHPPTDTVTVASLALDEEHYVGWTMQCGVEGTRARPLTARRRDSAIIVGHTETKGAVHQPWLWNSTAANDWLSLLGPYSQ